MTYRNSKGKFISKEEWLSLQPKKQEIMNNNKKKRFKKTPQVEDVIIQMDNSEEWVGESGKFEIKEGTQVVDLGSDFDVDKNYAQKVIEFVRSIESDLESIQNYDKALENIPVTKTPGFFTTWFKKWIW